MDSDTCSTTREQNCLVGKQEFKVIIQAEEKREKKKGYVSIGFVFPLSSSNVDNYTISFVNLTESLLVP